MTSLDDVAEPRLDDPAGPDLSDDEPALDGVGQGDLPAPPVHPPARDRRLPREARILVGVFGALALLTRLPRLTHPRVLVFDEIYYATQGLEVADLGVEVGHTVHPPFAKWLIGAGIRLFGFTPLGWRIVPLLAGVVVVMATVVAAYRLLDRLWLAALAGLVVLTDGVAFTTGRYALLDGIMAAFATVALAALATALARPLDVPLRRRVTWFTGVMLGLALACKWSAAALIPVALAVLAVLAWRTSTPGRHRKRAIGWTAGVLVGLPLAVYAITYVPTVVNFDDSAIGRQLCDKEGDCDPSLAARVTAVWRDHRAVLDFHQNLVPRNRYAHNAVSWVFQTEPVGLLKTHCPSADPVCDGTEAPESVRRIITIGNPVIWALGTLSLIVTFLLALWRPDGRMGLVAAWAAVLWLPWIVRPRAPWPLRVPFEPARPGYLFYAAPLVPVLAIALAMMARELRGRWRPGLTAALVAVAVIGAVVLYPAWTGGATSRDYLYHLVDR